MYYCELPVNTKKKLPRSNLVPKVNRCFLPSMRNCHMSGKLSPPKN